MKNLLLLLAAFLTSCSFFKDSNSLLNVDKIYVNKSERNLQLLDEMGGIIKEYDIRLGFNPIGHKLMEGDGKTPEGSYKIIAHNPYSKYYKSLRISYPNEADRRMAKALGVSPGGDVMLHGVDFASYTNHYRGKDWTAGCIAVKNRDMDEIYDLVRDGAVIEIVP